MRKGIKIFLEILKFFQNYYHFLRAIIKGKSEKLKVQSEKLKGKK
jgi:hypothetical protein